MTSDQQTNNGDTSDRELLSVRLLNAPRELVFRAWTEPEHIAQWWGPDGFTNTIHEMDVRPGGIWRVTMHGPDGRDYPNRVKFLEVTPPERLVYIHTSDHDDKGHFHVTVTFEAQGDKTLLTMRSVFANTAERDYVVKEYGAAEGMVQTINRLAVLLTTLS